MKTLLLIFTAFSVFAFGQKRNLDIETKDSVAVKNVNSILDYSKKTYFASDKALSLKSEIENNVNQLLINKNNFDNINGVRYGGYTTPWSLADLRLNTAGSQHIRTITTIPVYNSNKK
ncbi:hypothetical protein [Chryseobacterium chendengshani]|uniref:hypothetical protein n=1 Tax=unclassified Chryseobacterium TaxID=2593645 RepID=UPI001C63F60A|nr:MULTISPECIES: hypothetical protein [unclassified Chryseobacterium]MBW7676652.1 hypothetical protein [Chryseobacterium sp. LJ756]MBW8523194.1 hypothetical protein [Chryseobacterium sp. LJ668]QYK15490.1 hypothetical protein K0U91_10475 [Chryseobacterium sp. LJ668]